MTGQSTRISDYGKNNKNCKNDIFGIGDYDVEKCSKMDFTTNKNRHQRCVVIYSNMFVTVKKRTLQVFAMKSDNI